jgi:acetylornithine deacetylase/succinyl-diaminopimelate desuccinylase-like protein
MFPLLEEALALVRADTRSSRGTAAAADVLEPLWRRAGLQTERAAVEGDPAQVNLFAARPEQGDALLLVTHLDTVEPAPGWTRDPFRPEVEGDLLYGLGAADTKLDALCKIAAAMRVRERVLRRPFHFLGTCGEEVGLRGAQAFIASGRLRPRWVCVGEPSELRIVTSHKGYAVVECRIDGRGEVPAGPRRTMLFSGRAAHSSSPQLGVNAIEMALALLRAGPVVSIAGGSGANTVPASCEVVVVPEREGVSEKPAAPDLGPALERLRELRAAWAEVAPVTNLGQVATVDGALVATMDARLPPEVDPREAAAAFLARAPEARLVRAYAGMRTPEGSALLAAARAAARAGGLEDSPVAKLTSTEAGVFARAGAEAIVFGPGVSTGNAHAPDERQSLAQLSQAVDFYERLILSVCA